ncbi:Hypothetical protein FKW44_013796 [Caligus rogercresseyi]|uniref:Uncharacterized protein n=1 Tax=Caligus rogercresseyi TaxID=217165 RepID=A0A7T8JZA9_CALRO|nr:Hypothetical protein FKW44_013796 [Caligus rogercresseyi]
MAPEGLQSAPEVQAAIIKEEKQMVLSFFDNCGVIFQHYLLVRTSVTVAVFKDVMNMFLKKFKEK